MSNTSFTLEKALTQRLEAQQDVVNVDDVLLKLVVFSLDKERFAFLGGNIQEILADATVHFLPGCPPSLEGVINVRGEVQSVIRLRDVLGIPAIDKPTSYAILLGHSGEWRSGFRVDRVLDVLDLPQSLLQPPPSTLSEQQRPIVLGVLDLDGHPVTLLDFDKLLTDYIHRLA